MSLFPQSLSPPGSVEVLEKVVNTLEDVKQQQNKLFAVVHISKLYSSQGSKHWSVL